MTSTPRPRDRPKCPRCKGTRTITGPAVYPGSHVYRPQMPCPDCAPSTTRPTNRQQRQLAQRAWCADLLDATLCTRPEASEVSTDTRSGCLSYDCDGHRYLLTLTVTETQ